MAKFDYKKWVTENKYGKLIEQANSGCFYCDPYAYAQTQQLTLNPNSNPVSNYHCSPSTISGISDPQGLFANPDFGQTSIFSYNAPLNSGLYNVLDGQCAASASLITTSTTPTGSATSSGCYYCDPYAYAQTQQLTLDPNSTPNSNGYCSPSTISGISDPQGLFANPDFGQTSIFSYVVALQNTNDYNYIDAGCAASASLITTSTTPTGGPTQAGTGSFDDYGIGRGTQFNYPNNWSVTGWTDNFVEMMLAHPNPCNFLNQRYNQFGNQLQQGGMGPLQTNLVYQKFAVVHTLLELTGCGLPSPNPFTSLLQEQINEIKLDPAAKQILQKREKEIKGLSRKKETGKRKRRNENKINALKRIIKETLSELQEKQKACSCRNGICKTAGGDLCPSHECGGACKGSESGRDKKDE